MLNPKQMNVFKRDVKRLQKRGKDIKLMKALMNDLINEIPIDPKYKDHPLVGNYKGDRECHIEPDWLLIYTIIGRDLIFVRTGSHSDLY
jgi:mRNA interferase YafQ